MHKVEPCGYRNALLTNDQPVFVSVPICVLLRGHLRRITDIYETDLGGTTVINIWGYLGHFVIAVRLMSFALLGASQMSR